MAKPLDRFPRALIALTTPLVALGLAWLLRGFTRPHVWFLFYPAVFISGWIGGRRLGIIATALSSVLVWWFLIPPVLTPAISPGQFFSLVVFCATGIAFSIFHDRLTRAVAAAAARDQLAADLQAMTKLHEIGSLFLNNRENLAPVLTKILDAAIQISGSDFGSIQLVDPVTSDLKLVAQRGLSEERSTFGDPVGGGQSTPIVTRSGKAVGMFSTHHKRPRVPDARELRLLDLLARQAADIVEGWETNQRVAEALEASERANTRLKQVADERRIFAALLENSSDFIGIADPNGKPTYVNPAGRRMVGLAPDRLLDDTQIPDYYAPNQRRFAEEVILKTMLEEGSWEGETVFRHWQTEAAIPVSDKHFMIRDSDGGAVLGIGTITRDISDLRRAEDELRLANEELAEARNFLENVLESSTEYSIIAKDLDRRILAWNSGAARNYGYAADEVIGHSADLLHTPEDLRSGVVGELHARALESGHATGLFRRRRKDGSEFLARVVITRRNDARGHAIGYLLVSHDVTAEQRLVEEQRFLAEVGEQLQASLDPATTVERVAELVVAFIGDWCALDAVDDDGRVQRLKAAHADPAAAELASAWDQALPDPDRPHPLWDLLKTKQPQLLPAVSRELLLSMAEDDEHLRRLEAFEVRSLMLVPLVARGRLMAVLTVASRRPGRRYQTADVRLAQDLARRAALALDNAQLYAVAQDAIAARDMVLGVVAHDLRNPLGAILMQARALRRRDGQLERRSRRPGEAIERAATRMNRLIQDLLDVTRLEAGPLAIERERLPAGPIVAEALEAQQALAASAGLRIELASAEGLPDLWADRHRLLQVFENLLGNAIKFTRPGGHLTAGAASGGAEVLFWIADTGPGIPDEDQAHLFERFWQAKKVGRQGAGLGLPIVKGIVEAHGGRIWVESAPGRGTTFFFTIPTAPRADAWPASPDGAARE